MKKTQLAWTFLLAITMASCSQENITDKQSQKQIIMTASNFIYENDSRTNINFGRQGGGFTWSANDTVGIFPEEGTQVLFPMLNGAGTQSASFNGGGWALKPSSAYAAYYPVVDQLRLDKTSIPVNFEGQKQTGNASTAHLGKFDYMAAAATTPQSGNVKFQFKHLVSILELNLQVPKQGELTSVTLTADDCIFTHKGTVDLTASVPQITASALSNSLTIDLEQCVTTSDNENVKVYLITAPTNSSGKPIRISIINNGIQKETSIKSIRLEAGKAYKIQGIFNEQELTKASYHVFPAGTLQQLVGPVNKNSLTEITLSGELNGTDIRFLREMLGTDINRNNTEGKLNSIDMQNAKIIAGGNYYANIHEEYYTSDNQIGSYMFEGCPSLKNIQLPKTTTSIEEWAFANCTELTSIEIPNTVEYIGYYAFTSCNKLDYVYIPDSVINIYGGAFSYSSITSIRIPGSRLREELDPTIFEGSRIDELIVGEGMEMLPYDCFYDVPCKSIRLPKSLEMISPRSLPHSASYAYFYSSIAPAIRSACVVNGTTLETGLTKGCKIYVPKGCADNYKKANIWQDFYADDIYEMPDDKRYH